MFARAVLALSLLLPLPPAAASDVLLLPVASKVQENAIKDGCKKRYAKNKRKYNECVSGRSASSDNALIDGCYARYKHQRDKLRECLGR